MLDLVKPSCDASVRLLPNENRIQVNFSVKPTDPILQAMQRLKLYPHFSAVSFTSNDQIWSLFVNLNYDMAEIGDAIARHLESYKITVDRYVCEPSRGCDKLNRTFKAFMSAI